jgi:hypothetical protein
MRTVIHRISGLGDSVFAPHPKARGELCGPCPVLAPSSSVGLQRIHHSGQEILRRVDVGKMSSAEDLVGHAGLNLWARRRPPQPGHLSHSQGVEVADVVMTNASIQPFRDLIVYPALLRQVERSWTARDPGHGATAE